MWIFKFGVPVLILAVLVDSSSVSFLSRETNLPAPPPLNVAHNADPRCGGGYSYSVTIASICPAAQFVDRKPAFERYVQYYMDVQVEPPLDPAEEIIIVVHDMRDGLQYIKEAFKGVPSECTPVQFKIDPKPNYPNEGESVSISVTVQKPDCSVLVGEFSAVLVASVEHCEPCACSPMLKAIQ